MKEYFETMHSMNLNKSENNVDIKNTDLIKYEINLLN